MNFRLDGVEILDTMRINIQRSNALIFSWLLLSISVITGCASSAREIGAAASPVVVRSGLQEANAAEDQHQLQKLADSPAIHRLGQSLGEGLAVGLFNQANTLADGGAASSSTGGPTGSPTTAATTATSTLPTSQPAHGTAPGASAVSSLASGGLGMNGFVKSSVQEAFLAATDPQFKAGETAMSEAIGEGFITGMIKVLNKEGPTIGDTIHKQVGPIVQDLIREQIAPAVRDMLQQQLAPAALQVWREGAVETLKLTVRPDLQPDVQQNAQNASLGATRGTHQALIESGVIKPSGELNTQIKIGLWLAGIVAVALLAATICLLVILNLLAFHSWRHRQPGKKTER